MDDEGVLDALVQASFTVMALLNQVAAAHDLSLTQLRVLGILRGREPRLVELASYLGLERSSVSGLVDRAVRRGLVWREASAEDGRAVRLGLTAEGRELSTRGESQLRELLAPALERLTAGERQRVGVLLQRMLSS